MLKLIDKREIGLRPSTGDYYHALIQSSSKAFELEVIEDLDENSQNLGFTPDGNYLVTYQSDCRLFTIYIYDGDRYNSDQNMFRISSKMRLTQVSDDLVEFKGWWFTNDSKHLVVRISPRKRVHPPNPFQAISAEDQRSQLIDSITAYTENERDELFGEMVQSDGPSAGVFSRVLSVHERMAHEEMEEIEREREELIRQSLFINVVRDFRLGGNDRTLFLTFEISTGRIVSKLPVMNIIDSVYMNDRIFSITNQINENIDIYELTIDGAFNKIKEIRGIMKEEPLIDLSKQLISSYKKRKHHSHLRHRLLDKLFEMTVERDSLTIFAFFEITRELRLINVIPMNNGFLTLFWKYGGRTSSDVIVLINHNDPEFFDIFEQYDRRLEEFIHSFFADFLPLTMANINLNSNIVYIERAVFKYLRGIKCLRERFKRAIILVQLFRNINGMFLSPLLDNNYFRWETDFTKEILKRVDEYESPIIMDFEWNVIDIPPKLFCAKTGKLIVDKMGGKVLEEDGRKKQIEEFLAIPCFHPTDLMFIFQVEGTTYSAKLNQVKD